MTELLAGESGGQQHKLEPQATAQGDEQNAQGQSVVSNAADVLRHSAEDVRHALKRHAPDVSAVIPIVFGLRISGISLHVPSSCLRIAPSAFLPPDFCRHAVASHAMPDTVQSACTADYALFRTMLVRDRDMQLKVFGAQPSHGLMGSGSRVEARGPGQRIPRKLQRGELFQKIHSAMFVLLATVASTLDAGITWVRGLLTQLWNQVPYTAAPQKDQPEDMHPPTLLQDRDLAPAGSDAGVPAVKHPHTE